MRTSVLYEATDLTTRAALAAAVAQMPLPQDVLELVPCSLSATETQTNAGKIGRLIIAKLDGVGLYESEWTIAPA